MLPSTLQLMPWGSVEWVTQNFSRTKIGQPINSIQMFSEYLPCFQLESQVPEEGIVLNVFVTAALLPVFSR